MEAVMSSIIHQMALFLVLLIIGFVANKCGVLKGPALDGLSALICKIIIPLMVATMIPNGTNRDDFLSSLPFLLASFCLILSLWLLGIIVTKAGNMPPKDRGVYQAMGAFGNMGFLGIPLLVAVFGQKAMLYIALFSVADQVLLWTLGNILVTSKKDGIISKLKMLLNPCIIGILIGLTIMLLGFKPNNVVWQALEGVGGTTTYLALIYIGAILAEVNLGDLSKAKSVWLLVLTKMLAFPIVLFALLTVWGLFDYMPRLMLAMIAGLPCMVTVVMMARLSGKGEKFAACGIFVTTICSIFTLPFVVYICNLIAR